MTNKPAWALVGTLSSSFSLVQNGTLPRGAYVSEVESKSPAEAAGLQPGDIIVEAAGTVISSHQELIAKLAEFKEGDEITLKYFRAENLAGIVKGEKSVDTLGEGSYQDATVSLKVLSDKL